MKTIDPVAHTHPVQRRWSPFGLCAVTAVCAGLFSPPSGWAVDLLTQHSGQRDALATGMTFVWAQTDPINAAQFVAHQIPPGPVQDEAPMMVLHQWVLADLAGARAWALQFPENPLRNRALNELSGMAQYKQAIARSK